MFARNRLDLSTREGLAAFETEAADMIRRGVFSEANTFFLRSLRAVSGPYQRLCQASADRYVAIDGWDEAFADIETLARRGLRVGAFGVFLSGHGDGPEPALTSGYYDAAHFDVSRASLELETRGHGGAGAFAAMAGLTVRGLASIYGALRHSPSLHWNDFGRAPPPADFAGVTVAKWYLVFRIHHAIKRDLDKQGMPNPLPVIVGAHDFGVQFGAAYQGQRGVSREKAVSRVLERRAKLVARDYERQTEEVLRTFRKRRANIGGWRPDRNPDKRETYVGFVEASEKLMLNMLGLSTVRRTWQMDDLEFEAFLEKVRGARAARAWTASGRATS